MSSGFDFSAFFYPLAPPIFSLAGIAFSRFENYYFDQQASRIAGEENLNTNTRDIVANTAKSSALLKNYLNSFITTVLSLLIAFNEWPDTQKIYRLMVPFILLFIFIGYFPKLFSLRLDSFYGAKAPRRIFKSKETNHYKFYYSRIVTAHQIFFNCCLIIILIIGYIITRP